MQTKDYAKQIREELKKAFPGIKFSVRSNVYSMGSSINVRWVDGPVESAVREVIQKFEQVSRCEFSGEILSGGNMYVFADRSYSTDKGSFIYNGLDMTDSKPELKEMIKVAFDYLRHFSMAKSYGETDLTWEIEVGRPNMDLTNVRDAFNAAGYESHLENPTKLVVCK